MIRKGMMRHILENKNNDKHMAASRVKLPLKVREAHDNALFLKVILIYRQRGQLSRTWRGAVFIPVLFVL